MPAVFKLDEECAIYQATTLRQQLADALMATDSLSLDLSGVSEIDCSAVQVFLWLQQEAQRLQKEVCFERLSEPVQQFFQVMGFAPLLHLSTTRPSMAEVKHES